MQHSQCSTNDDNNPKNHIFVGPLTSHFGIDSVALRCVATQLARLYCTMSGCKVASSVYYVCIVLCPVNLVVVGDCA